jgi:hypothetical protein
MCAPVENECCKVMRRPRRRVDRRQFFENSPLDASAKS